MRRFAERARLREREARVVELAAQGVSRDGIARELTITPNTLKTYVKRIPAKCDALRLEQVVSLAFQPEADA